MARGVNMFVGIGYLGADPETRYLTGGTAVTTFNVGITETWKDKDSQSNEIKERTEWVRCEVWGKRAEIASQYLRKGSLVYFEGSLRTDQWEKDGQTRYSTKVRVRNFQMLGKPEASQSTPPASDGVPFNDDIPF